MTTFSFLLRATAASTAIVCSLGAAAEQSLEAHAREQFAFAAKQYAGLLKQMEGNTTAQPRTIEAGKLRKVPPQDWTSGFFPGSLWLIYEQTKEPALQAAAEDFTHRLKEIQNFTGHHDVGFMLGCSYGEGYRLTGNKEYRDILVQGACSLATRYSAATGLIRSWDFGEWKYPVIVDNMMNLPLLWFAAGETGEPRFKEIATNHANKTLANHFRPDGSSFHLVDYDPASGAVTKKQTVQGYADASSWARGQAWGLAGFTTMARLTRDPAYLAQARKIADFIVSHPRLPVDGVPYWDFDAPGIPNAPRDASAAAIMACGLLELEKLVDKEGAPYRALAERQLRSLSSSAYRAKLDENGNFLLMHCVGHHPQKSEVDVPLNYADYYFLKGLSYLLGREPTMSGVP